MSTDKKQLDLAAVRARLNSVRGREYWRTLEELARTPAFEEYLHREFPDHASTWSEALDRRGFLRLMGASLALAGVTSCTTQPLEKIIPYVRAPEQLIPGKPLFFATAMSLGGRAIGLLAESQMGRPTKLEGNPSHPASLGATDPFSQASVLSLYDPDRAQVVSQQGRIRSWSAFQMALSAEVVTLKNNGGKGFRLLTETVSSPTLLAQIKEILSLFPQARRHQYEPVNRDNVLRGAIEAFGRPLNSYYRLDQADVVVCVGCDLFFDPMTGVRYARDLGTRRRVTGESQTMNRVYAIETMVSNTGSIADHRLAVKPSEMGPLVSALLRACSGGNRGPTAGEGNPGDRRQKWVSAIARDLLAHRGRSLIVAGDHESPAIHAMVHRINGLLGNLGSTVVLTEPAEPDTMDQGESLRQLVKDMNAGQVDTLLMLGGNPVFTAPADLKFSEALAKVRLRVALSEYATETSDLCDWHIPEAHYLEAWGDARAFDGTVSLIQPLIQPLFGGKSAYEVLSVMTGRLQSGYQIVRRFWQTQRPGPDFERFWVRALNDGVVPDTLLPEVRVTPRDPAGGAPETATAAATESGLEIIFRPDPTIYDGRFANNGWLQELPKPLTKLTWDNAVLIAPSTAERLDLQNEQVVELRYKGRKVQGPVWILPGHAEGAITVHFGYGGKTAGRVGGGTGFNVYQLRTSDSPWQGSGAILSRTGATYQLASTQAHWALEGRGVVRTGTLDEYRKEPHFAHEEHGGGKDQPSLYPEYDYREGNAWGMAIDLTACMGCNACVVACQAENNVPVVGKEQVGRQREMHWLRIDRYFEGDLDNPRVYHQPMLCQHCEKAPCEVVCPVAATVHDSEGLNEMIYNRCVGTRYCSNNCPYKVRRFNFFQYSDKKTPSLQLLYNPDVTVRDRGVMEKCTYCVQRIMEARIQAEKDNNRPIKDGEVVTACQAACPTQAIVFGNLNDPNSQVTRLKKLPLNYSVLGELNTQPRTTYLAALRNPNPELES